MSFYFLCEPPVCSESWQFENEAMFVALSWRNALRKCWPQAVSFSLGSIFSPSKDFTCERSGKSKKSYNLSLFEWGFLSDSYATVKLTSALESSGPENSLTAVSRMNGTVKLIQGCVCSGRSHICCCSVVWLWPDARNISKTGWVGIVYPELGFWPSHKIVSESVRVLWGKPVLTFDSVVYLELSFTSRS